jgi:hypothetical protein
MRSVAKAGRILALAVLAIAWAAITVPALAQQEQEEEAPDQIVLSGRAEIPRGQTAGQVVVFRGVAVIEGVAGGDVIVVSGRAVITGQVSGSVVNLDGSVVLGPSAQVGEDVLARGRVVVRGEAQVQGEIRQNVPFSLRGPVGILGGFAAWLAVTISTLLLGLLLLWLAPRATESVLSVARATPVVAAAWGLALFVGIPLACLVLIMSLVGLPLGVMVLLAFALLLSIGYAWTEWVIGRLVVGPARGRIVALLVGLGMIRVVGLIPFVGGLSFMLAGGFGLGALTVAVWRARGVGGKHRSGRVDRTVVHDVHDVREPEYESLSEPTAEPPVERVDEPT